MRDEGEGTGGSSAGSGDVRMVGDTGAGERKKKGGGVVEKREASREGECRESARLSLPRSCAQHFNRFHLRACE